MIKRLFFKILVLALILGVNLVGMTNANLSDAEHSNGNTFTAGSVDLSLKDSGGMVLTSPLFSISGMKPGDFETKTVKVTKEGILDFQYSVKAAKTGGDNDLCDALKIEAKLDGVSQYNNSLTGMDLNPAATISGGKDTWDFVVRLESTDAGLQNKTCNFDLIVKGWQVGSNGTWGLMDTESLANNITTGDWTPPSSVSLSITGSFTKSITENITNGGFESGLTGWTKAGDVQLLSIDNIAGPSTTINPHERNNMVRIGNPDNPGNYVWENRLMGSFDSGAKSLSLNYNFFSRDFSPFDDPGFFIRLNGQEIFKLNTLSVNPTDKNDGFAYNTGWSEFYYDLSNQTDSKVNLSLYAGNNGYGDKDVQSWVYIDEITTYFVSAPAHAAYTLSGDDDSNGSGINHYEYKIDGAGWLIGNTFGNTSPLSNGGEHTVLYRSVDNAGNYSPISTVRIITDDKAPSAITDLSVDPGSETPNSVSLSWNAPYNDLDNPASGKAALYDVRYSTAPINESNFAGAVKVDKIPSPKEHNTLDPLDVFFDLYQEHLEITGLNPSNPSTTYYFAVKSADEAPNWSGISNVVLATTLSGATVNAGDVVINELMWMGSSASDADEWLELRNMTNRTIYLSGFSLTKFDGTNEVPMVISFAGKSIAPHGYFLIANVNSYAGGDSQLKDTITPNIWDSSLDLDEDHLRIKFYDSASNLIDEAWNNTEPKEGYYEINSKYYSMERTSVPGDGRDPLNWYTCIDGASTADFFDGGSDERGTPGAANRSENEPLVNQPSFPRITSTLIESETVPSSTPAPNPDVQENASGSAEITTEVLETGTVTDKETETQEPVETPEPAVQPEATPEAIVEEPQTEVQESVEQEPATEPEPLVQPTQPEEIVNV